MAGTKWFRNSTPTTNWLPNQVTNNPIFAFRACDYCGNDIYPGEQKEFTDIRPNGEWHRSGCFRCCGCHRLFSHALKFIPFQNIAVCQDCFPRREILQDEWVVTHYPELVGNPAECRQRRVHFNCPIKNRSSESINSSMSCSTAGSPAGSPCKSSSVVRNADPAKDVPASAVAPASSVAPDLSVGPESSNAPASSVANPESPARESTNYSDPNQDHMEPQIDHENSEVAEPIQQQLEVSTDAQAGDCAQSVMNLTPELESNENFERSEVNHNLEESSHNVGNCFKGPIPKLIFENVMSPVSPDVLQKQGAGDLLAVESPPIRDNTITISSRETRDGSSDRAEKSDECRNENKVSSDELPQRGRRRSNSNIELSDRDRSLLQESFASASLSRSLIEGDLLAMSANTYSCREDEKTDLPRHISQALTPSPFPQCSTPIHSRSPNHDLERPPSTVPTYRQKPKMSERSVWASPNDSENAFESLLKFFQHKSSEQAHSGSCANCAKPVYPSETIKCLNKVYHRSCFHCVTCRARLNLSSYRDSDGLPYCKKCYQVNVMSQANMATTMSVMSRSRLGSF